MNRAHIVAATMMIISAVVMITGCGNDASVSSRDKGPAEKINFPDQFNTIANKCDNHGFRIYESSGKGAMAVVRDPTCGHG